MAGYQIRCIREKIVHFLKREVLRLRQEQIEEQRIREVADDKEVVVFVPDVGHRSIGDLPDQSVEGEGDHGRDRDTFGSGPGVEDLGGDDPGQGAAGRGEGEVVEPGADDEAPGCCMIIRRSWWEFGDQDASDEEADHIEEVTGDQRTSTSELVDE